jgi:hypothetical protein
MVMKKINLKDFFEQKLSKISRVEPPTRIARECDVVIGRVESFRIKKIWYLRNSLDKDRENISEKYQKAFDSTNDYDETNHLSRKLDILDALINIAETEIHVYLVETFVPCAEFCDIVFCKNWEIIELSDEEEMIPGDSAKLFTVTEKGGEEKIKEVAIDDVPGAREFLDSLKDFAEKSVN